MQQRKSKIILVYFFLLIILGSINNTSLQKIKFSKVENINISGLNYYNNTLILEDLKSSNLESIFFLDRSEIKKIIESNKLIEKYKIFKKYPSTLDIEIDKTYFLANINKNGSTFVIGSNGKLIKNDFSIKELPFVFGNPKISEFLNLKKIIEKSNISYDNIKNFYFFKSKRWDIELKSKILIKLSGEYTKGSLENALEIMNNNHLKNFKIIDARVKNKINIYD